MLAGKTLASTVSVTLEADAGSLVALGRTPVLEACADRSSVNASLALDGQNFVPVMKSLQVFRKDPIKIGFLLIGSPSDSGWNFQHNQARLNLMQRFGAQIEIVVKERVSSEGLNMCTSCSTVEGWDDSRDGWQDEPSYYKGTHEAAQIMYDWMHQGFKLVFATSYWFQWDTWYLARQFPNQFFVHTSGSLTRKNMANVFPKIYQARYLTGIVMGWHLKQNPHLKKKVGCVSAYKLGETVRAINAFKLGLAQVDPEIEVYVVWVQTWENVRKERVAASRLFEMYDVEGITLHTDTIEVQKVANEYGKVSVGYNTDTHFFIGDSVLTSAVLEWSAEYENMVQSVIDGDSDFGHAKWIGHSEGGCRLSGFSPKVSAEAQRHVAAERERFHRGEDHIFCQPNLTDNKGRVRNGKFNPAEDPVPWELQHLKPGTTCLTDDVVLQSCQKYQGLDCVEHWLLEGVHDSCAPSASRPQGIQSSRLPEGTCFLGNLDIPESCDPGQHWTIMGCTPARPGFYATGIDEQPCQPGSAAPTSGLAVCLPCQPGYSAALANSTSCLKCRPGQFAEGVGESACHMCPFGQFASTSGATRCQVCPQGKHSFGHGASECTSCDAALPGSTSPPGSGSLADCVCPTGAFNDVRQGTCSACPSAMTCAGGNEPPRSVMADSGSLMWFLAASAIEILFLVRPLQQALSGWTWTSLRAAGTARLAVIMKVFRSDPRREQFACKLQRTLCQMVISVNMSFTMACLVAIIQQQISIVQGLPGQNSEAITWSLILLSLMVLVVWQFPSLIRPQTVDVWLFCIGILGVCSLSPAHLSANELGLFSMLLILPRLVICILARRIKVSLLWTLAWYTHIFVRLALEIEPAQHMKLMLPVIVECTCFLVLTGLARSLLIAVLLQRIQTRSERLEFGDACASLLSLTCDVVVKLDANLRVAEQAPGLAALLLHGPGSTLQGRDFVDLISSDSDEGAQVQSSLLASLQNSTAYTCRAHMNDSCGTSSEFDIFHVNFANKDDKTQLLVGLRECTDLQKPGPLPMQKDTDASGTDADSSDGEDEYTDLSHLTPLAKFASFNPVTNEVVNFSERLKRALGGNPDLDQAWTDIFSDGDAKESFNNQFSAFLDVFHESEAARCRSFEFDELTMIVPHLKNPVPVKVIVTLFMPANTACVLTGFVAIKSKKGSRGSGNGSCAVSPNTGFIEQLASGRQKDALSL